jgi:hypothetical protein
MLAFEADSALNGVDGGAIYYPWPIIPSMV